MSIQAFFYRIRPYFATLGAIYVLIVALLCTPFIQSHTIYLNAIRYPFFADFNLPEKYGLAPNKTLNLKINTPDNETLGAWFVLSDKYYHALPSIPVNMTTHVKPALERHPTVLFFHGNAATRAFKARVMHYQAYSARLAANVLAIDYRGFAESTGTPSEAGLVIDARAAWDWLIDQGARSEDILIVGHSLGTGVSSQLAAQLSRDGIKYRGVVLMAPFSSIREVLNTYHIFGFLPLMKPLTMIPWATNLISWALVHKFDTLQAVPDISAPVLIAHAKNDLDIPYTHSEVLFSAFLEPHLPPLDIPQNPFTMTPDEWATFSSHQTVRQSKREEILTKKEITGFGTVEEFEADGRRVMCVKTLAGEHDYLGTQEGLQDVIRKSFAI